MFNDKSLTRDFQVNTVAVIFVAAMCVEQAFSAQTEEGLSRGYQVVPVDTNPHMLLLPLDVVCGGHAGAICLAFIARLLTVCAVTTECCRKGQTVN